MKNEVRILDFDLLKSQGAADGKNDMTIVLASDLAPVDVLDLIVSQGFASVIQENRELRDQRLKVASELVVSPEKFIENPIESILGQLPTQAMTIEFDDSKKKDLSLQQMREFTLAVPGTQTVVDSLIRIADELYTNAVYNAPRVPQARSEQIKLSQNQKAKIELGVGRDRLAIACTDFFGALNTHVLMRRIWECYQQGLSSAIRMDTPGAGIGAHFIFDTASSFFAFANQNRWTVVGCTLPLSLGNKQTQQVLKSVQIAWIQNTHKGASQSMGNMKVESLGSTAMIKIGGDLDEDAVMSSIQVKTGVLNQIDMGEVVSINSCGIREWVKWKKALSTGTVFEIHRCPKVVVDQINMLDGFLPVGSKIASFFVPYYCETCEAVENRLFTNGIEYDGKMMRLPAPHACSKCAKPMEIDVIEAKYFKFLSELG